jgi:hypothetical protein
MAARRGLRRFTIDVSEDARTVTCDRRNAVTLADRPGEYVGDEEADLRPLRSRAGPPDRRCVGPSSPSKKARVAARRRRSPPGYRPNLRAWLYCSIAKPRPKHGRRATRH